MKPSYSPKAVGAFSTKHVLSKIDHTFVVSDPTLPDCPVIFASDSFLRLTGYSREEVLGHNCRFLQGEDTDQVAVRQLRKAVTRAEAVTVRILNYKKSGAPFWNLLTLSPVKNSAGKVVKIVGVQIDITSRASETDGTAGDGIAAVAGPLDGCGQLAQAATGAVSTGILGAEDPAASAKGTVYEELSRLPHTFIVSDPLQPDCPITYASQGFLELTGYELHEVLGRNCRFLQGEKTDRAAVEELKAAIGRGHTVSVRLLNYKKSGEPFWNLLTVTPMKNSSGETVKLIGVQIDVTRSTEGGFADRSIVHFDARATEIAREVVRQVASGINSASARVSSSDGRGAPVGRRQRQSLAKRLSEHWRGVRKGHIANNRVRHLQRRVPRVALDLATTVERLEHAFVVCDPSMEECPIVFASDVLLRMVGLPREAVLGRHLTFLLGPDPDPDDAKKLCGLLGAMSESSMLIEAYRSCGKTFPAIANMLPMKDVRGVCKFVVATIVNISKERPDDSAKSLLDTESVSFALQDLMADGNPFEELDRLSGRVRHRHHCCTDRGYQLLMQATEDGDLRIEHFRPVRHLGNGASGQVNLMELSGTGHVFAIKSVSKQYMMDRNKVSRVIAEDRVLSQIDHPFLALCYGTISTATHIHYIMRSCEGGDLYQLMASVGEFSESQLRFYAAEIILALEYLHLLGYVYRDLKPENILVDNGHVVLTDFDLTYTKGTTNPRIEEQPQDEGMPPLPPRSGLCSRVAGSGDCQLVTTCGRHHSTEVQLIGKYTKLIANPTARANSFVGTQEYIAPEIIKGTGHSGPVDWWSFGILCYELVFGRTPFGGETRDETFDNILQQELTFPSHKPLSPPFRELLLGLLSKEPNARLGAKGGASEVKSHPFFEGTNWPLLHHYRPPFHDKASVSASDSAAASSGKASSADTGTKFAEF
uniref:non-specific serine/threonine protein kinase n=1 Tax=Tetraselmis sp. GSL018 TaxID=582737 RepID=A0A061S5M9_9CHLO